jgi:hypothetical protein
VRCGAAKFDFRQHQNQLWAYPVSYTTGTDASCLGGTFPYIFMTWGTILPFDFISCISEWDHICVMYQPLWWTILCFKWQHYIWMPHKVDQNYIHSATCRVDPQYKLHLNNIKMNWWRQTWLSNQQLLKSILKEACFRSQLQHSLSWLGLFMVFLSPSTQNSWAVPHIRPWAIPFNSVIHWHPIIWHYITSASQTIAN